MCPHFVCRHNSYSHVAVHLNKYSLEQTTALVQHYFDVVPSLSSLTCSGTLDIVALVESFSMLGPIKVKFPPSAVIDQHCRWLNNQLPARPSIVRPVVQCIARQQSHSGQLPVLVSLVLQQKEPLSHAQQPVRQQLGGQQPALAELDRLDVTEGWARVGSVAAHNCFFGAVTDAL